jgi:hypothetical protein
VTQRNISDLARLFQSEDSLYYRMSDCKKLVTVKNSWHRDWCKADLWDGQIRKEENDEGLWGVADPLRIPRWPVNEYDVNGRRLELTLDAVADENRGKTLPKLPVEIKDSISKYLSEVDVFNFQRSCRDARYFFSDILWSSRRRNLQRISGIILRIFRVVDQLSSFSDLRGIQHISSEDDKGNQSRFSRC